MTKEQVIKVRKELHNLPGKERGVALPLKVIGGDGNACFSEADVCMLWDDANELVYFIFPNTVETQTTDSRLYPMCVKVMDYASIEFIGTVLDRLCLDNLLKAKVDEAHRLANVLSNVLISRASDAKLQYNPRSEEMVSFNDQNELEVF